MLQISLLTQRSSQQYGCMPEGLFIAVKEFVSSHYAGL